MESKQSVGFSDVLKEFADSSTWHGIPKIASSRQLAVKILWCILFIIASCAVSIQLFELIQTYRSYPIQTKVSLEFSELQFPAISFCNMNPVRKSQIHMSPLLKETIYPKKKKRKQKTSKVKRSVDLLNNTGLDTMNFPGMMGTVLNIGATVIDNSSLLDAISNRSIEDVIDTIREGIPDIDNYIDLEEYEYEYDEWNYHYFDYIDEYEEDNSTDDVVTERTVLRDEIHGVVSSSEHFQDPKDKWEALASKIHTYYRNESLHTRQKMGHQKGDFIQRALFYNRQQNVSKYFKEFTTTDYGNCFTMDHPKYRALQSGNDNGVRLTLYLEVDEYIENHSSGFGVRMVFHEPGTFPLPVQEGLTLNPGFETSIGLRAINVTRLGQPYGGCSHGHAFTEKYNVAYSKSACLEFCLIDHIIAYCGCMPYNTPDLLNKFAANVSVCRDWNEMEEYCMYFVSRRLQEDKSHCDCDNPCTEFKYQMTISGRSWPNKGYLEKVLMRDLCAQGISSSEKACFQVKNESEAFNYERYKNNFARVLIYFEDLNYETITEEPSYSPVRFISDIGGTVGLFLGTSLLSLFEVLQLLLEIVLYLKHRCADQPVNDAPTKV